MIKTPYRNFQHYIQDGWATEPKESFSTLVRHIAEACEGNVRGELLDVGCATGELIGFLSSAYPELRFTGADVFEELLEVARKLLPTPQFVRASALELPAALQGRFDIVTAVGVMSVFDETQIEAFWRGLLRAARPGGWVIVLSPLNEYNVDTMIRHRKRLGDQVLSWETGWNIFAIDTIRAVVAGLGADLRIEPFRFERVLEPRADPVRTWTLPTEKNPRQLTNGLKLLVDHYFMIVRAPSAEEGRR